MSRERSDSYFRCCAVPRVSYTVLARKRVRCALISSCHVNERRNEAGYSYLKINVELRGKMKEEEEERVNVKVRPERERDRPRPTHSVSRPHRFDVGFRQIPVQLSQMEERERHADDVDDDPEHVEDVMTEGPVHQGATGRVVAALRVRRQGPAEKRGSQIDRDAGEPDHESAEQHALRKKSCESSFVVPRREEAGPRFSRKKRTLGSAVSISCEFCFFLLLFLQPRENSAAPRTNANCKLVAVLN